MEKFYLEINLGNSAMQTEEDISDAIKQLHEKILTSNEGVVHDYNGNTVGKWWFK